VLITPAGQVLSDKIAASGIKMGKGKFNQIRRGRPVPVVSIRQNRQKKNVQKIAKNYIKLQKIASIQQKISNFCAKTCENERLLGKKVH